MHFAQFFFSLQWGKGLHTVQLPFSLRCGQGLESAHLRFSLPRGLGLHSVQFRFNLPWGQGLHSAQLFLSLPWEHRAVPSFAVNCLTISLQAPSVCLRAARCDECTDTRRATVVAFEVARGLSFVPRIFYFSETPLSSPSNTPRCFRLWGVDAMPADAVAACAAEAALLDAARVGTVEDVRLCLSRVSQESLGEIDAPSGLAGVTPLHAAASRGDPDVVQVLLDAGAAVTHSQSKPLRADFESGWTPMHRAVYHGKWRVMAMFLAAGASLDHPVDFAGRGPLDVLAARLKRTRDQNAGASHIASQKTKVQHLSRTRWKASTRDDENKKHESKTKNRAQRDLYSWGVGVNYQLGHGSRDDVLGPKLVEDLVGIEEGITSFDASKYHSVAVTNTGSVFSWGHGRGGRLGIDDANIFNGDVAALRPVRVHFGVTTHVKVIQVATGKHHTLCVTTAGEVFSWGRAADGRLGYEVKREISITKNDDVYQQTPRKVGGALRLTHVTDITCSNKHSVVLTRIGEVYAFGSNQYGQLGRRQLRAPVGIAGNLDTNYSFSSSTNTNNNSFLSGSYDKGSPNALTSPSSIDKPKTVSLNCWTSVCVESLKPKTITAVSAAKRHTVVLDDRGVVYQFGCGDYAPKRVQTKSKIVSIAAGPTMSLMRTVLGEVQGWWSNDASLNAFHVRGFGFSDSASSCFVTSIGMSKTRGALVTDGGDLFTFDVPSPKQINTSPLRFKFTKVNGMRRVHDVHIGELHTLATQQLTRQSPKSVVKNADHVNEDVLYSTVADRLAKSEDSDDNEYASSEELSADDSEDDSSHDSETSALWFGEDDEHVSSTPKSNQKTFVPSLCALSQASLAQQQCDTRSVFELLEFANSVGAVALAKFCVTFASENMDAIFSERGASVFENTSDEALVDLEEYFLEYVSDASSYDAGRAFQAFAARTGARKTDELPGDTNENDSSAEDEHSCSSSEEVWRDVRRFGRGNETRTYNDTGSEPSQDPSESIDLNALRQPEVEVSRSPLQSNAPTGPSWLEQRVTGVLRPSPVSANTKTKMPLSQRSRHNAAEAAASRIARGGLSLFLSGALENAVAREGGDAAVAEAAAEKEKERNAPGKTWDVCLSGSQSIAQSGSAPSGSTPSLSLREIAGQQAHESAAAVARARGYSATAARDIMATRNQSQKDTIVTYSPTFSPRREIPTAQAGGAVAVSLTHLARRNRGAYGGRGEARLNGFDTQPAAWAVNALNGSRGGSSVPSSAPLLGPSLSEILREEEEKAAALSKNAPAGSFGSYGSSLTRGSGATGWFINDQQSPSGNNGLMDIVRGEELQRETEELIKEELEKQKSSEKKGRPRRDDKRGARDSRAKEKQAKPNESTGTTGTPASQKKKKNAKGDTIPKSESPKVDSPDQKPLPAKSRGKSKPKVGEKNPLKKTSGDAIKQPSTKKNVPKPKGTKPDRRSGNGVQASAKKKDDTSTSTPSKGDAPEKK